MSGSGPGPSAERARGEDTAPGGALRRRFVSLSVLFLALVLLLGGLSLWLLLGLLVDLLNRLRGRPLRFAAARCALFLTLVVAAESWGVLVSGLLWLRRGAYSRDEWLEAHYALQRRWADLILAGTTRLYQMRVQTTGDELLDGRPVLLLMRHVSVGDGLLAVRHVNSARGYRLRFVLKRELLWDPCLDIVGGRLPNAFVKRDGDDSAREIARVRALADDLGPGDGVIVFAEGTRFTPERQARALARLEAQGQTALLARGRRLVRSLPPRPGGVLGLLEQNPQLDIVVCGHVGLEAGTRLPDFVNGALVGQTLQLRFWRYSAAELPKDAEGRLLWLYDRWLEMDAWADAAIRAARGAQATG